MRLRAARASLAVCLLVLAACQSPQPRQGQSERAEPTAGPAPAPAAPPPKPPEPKSDRAYVNVERVGVYVIDEQGWRLVWTPMIGRRVLDLAELDGRLHLLTGDGVSRGGVGFNNENVAGFDNATDNKLGEPFAMAVARGNIWVTGTMAVGHTPDYSWKVLGANLFHEDLGPMPWDVVLDASGDAWLAGGSLVVHADGPPWYPVELPLSFPPAPRKLEVSADGQTIVVDAGCVTDEAGAQTRCGLVRFDLRADNLDPTTYEIDTSACTNLKHFALSPNASIAVLTGECGLVRVDLSKPESAPRWLSPNAPLGSAGLAIDDRGRVWVGALAGFSIVDPDDRVTSYPLARLGDIAGRVDGLLVTGAGPKLPELGPQRRGSLQVTFVHSQGEAEIPVPSAKVELCERPLAPTDPTRSVCADNPVAQGVTDAEGTVEFRDLPLGGYTLAVEVDGRWVAPRADATIMVPDKTHVLREVVVPSLE